MAKVFPEDGWSRQYQAAREKAQQQVAKAEQAGMYRLGRRVHRLTATRAEQTRYRELSRAHAQTGAGA